MEKELEQIKHFNFQTGSHRNINYRLLISDEHKSHYPADFELHLKGHKIITLYMRAHWSHKSRPPDVGCFCLLKRMHNKEIENLIQASITNITTEDFFFFSLFYGALC